MLDCRNSAARLDCLLMLHVDVAVIGMGILNLECAVRPPGIIIAAIPDVAVAKERYPSL